MNNELIARLRLRDDNEHQTADLDALAAAAALEAAEARAVEAEQWMKRAAQMDNEKTVRLVDANLRAETAERQLVAAREALEWYAEQARLCRLIHSEGDSGRHALSADGGKRARAVLSDAPAPVGGEACAIIRGFMACVELDIDAQDKDPETLALETRALRFLSDAPAPVSKP